MSWKVTLAPRAGRSGDFAPSASITGAFVPGQPVYLSLMLQPTDPDAVQLGIQREWDSLVSELRARLDALEPVVLARATRANLVALARERDTLVDQAHKLEAQLEGLIQAIPSPDGFGEKLVDLADASDAARTRAARLDGQFQSVNPISQSRTREAVRVGKAEIRNMLAARRARFAQEGDALARDPEVMDKLDALAIALGCALRFAPTDGEWSPDPASTLDGLLLADLLTPLKS